MGVFDLPMPHASTARLRFPVMLQSCSVLGVAASINGETAIFGIYYKEALCSPLIHVSTARLRFSVYIEKKLLACRCSMHQWRNRDFRYIQKRSSVLAVDACINGETAIFGKYYKEALCSPLLHVSTARLRFSAHIKKKLFARRCSMHQWRDRNFRYIQKRSSLCSLLMHVSTARLRFSVNIMKKPCARQ